MSMSYFCDFTQPNSLFKGLTVTSNKMDETRKSCSPSFLPARSLCGRREKLGSLWERRMVDGPHGAGSTWMVIQSEISKEQMYPPSISLSGKLQCFVKEAILLTVPQWLSMGPHYRAPGEGLYGVARDFCLALPGCCLAKHGYLLRGLCTDTSRFPTCMDDDTRYLPTLSKPEMTARDRIS